MNRKLAALFPGQGAQHVGMGEEIYNSTTEGRDCLEEAEDILHLSLKPLMLEGPLSELTATRNSQVALFVTSVATYRVLRSTIPTFDPSTFAGLSLGEYTALHLSGKIDFATGCRLIRKRAELMDEVAQQEPQGKMEVVLGLEGTVVEEVVNPLPGVWVANFNGPKQQVISGTVEGVDRASSVLSQLPRARLITLGVSGAFHTPLMSAAQAGLQEEIESIEIVQNKSRLVMNVPGDYVDASAQIVQFLMDQMVCPVRWLKQVRAMQREGVELFVEVGTGSTLTGIHRKIGGGQAVALGTPEQIDRFAERYRVWSEEGG